MQVLTIPASVAKRKQACTSCRQRKKKCDAQHPCCGLCRKLGVRCRYTNATSPEDDNILLPTSRADNPSIPPPSVDSVESSYRELYPLEAGDYGFDIAQSDTLEFMQLPDMNFGLTDCNYWTQPNRLLEHPPSEFTNIQPDRTVSFESLGGFQLPSHDTIVQLAGLFFEHLGQMFPCFHRNSFLMAVADGTVGNHAPILLYAICCVSARYHPDNAIKKCSKDWYDQARILYELTRRLPKPGLRTIQAIPLLVFYAWTVGDYCASWLFLGKAWRQAVMLGLNRMDIGQEPAERPAASELDAENDTPAPLVSGEGVIAIEKEEQRRALWLLFIMDRMHAWPTGWPSAIPETQFKVNIPVPENFFQAMNSEGSGVHGSNVTFTRNLSDMISSSSSAKTPLNILHLLIVAHVLLGRASELVYCLHNSPGSLEYAEDCTKLDNFVVKFRLGIPRQAYSVLETSPADRVQVVWLHVILNTITVILNYRRDHHSSDSHTSPPFRVAVVAARNTAQIVKDASRISIDLLLSAHFGSSLYLAACVLVIEWRLTRDESLKDDIDLLRLVFERMDEVFSFLGLKYKIALEHELQKSREELLSLRERGFRGLLADCTKWEHVKEEVQRRGLEVDLS